MLWQLASDRIATTLASLGTLEAAADTALRPEYDNFADQVDALNSSARAVKRDFSDVGQSTEERFRTWNEGIANLSNPDFQKRSRERLDESKQKYAKVASEVETTTKKFDDLCSDLNDIKESLGFDLTKKGLETWKDEIASAKKNGNELRSTFSETIDGLEEVKEAMSAGTPPPVPTPSSTGT